MYRKNPSLLLSVKIGEEAPSPIFTEGREGGGGSVHRLPKKRRERKKKCLSSDIIERTSISKKAATWTRLRCSGVLVELENMAQNFTCFAKKQLPN